MGPRASRLLRAAIVLAVAAVVGVAAWWLFLVSSSDLADVVGVLLVIAGVVVGIRVAGRLAASALPSYNVAEVAVEGPITRDGRGVIPTLPGGTPADDVVEQIERADGARAAKALLLKLNTPGGEVVPSDDIRRAARAFDGPTIAYATDTCASGGYWIASGCDELWAHEASVVGSIGVIGSTVNAAELAEKVGLSYERFAAGKFKDAGTALKEMTDDERAYLQGLIDDFYEGFVERVAEGRDLEPAEIRETEARVYLGEEAHELGLVDEIGTREDVEERLEQQLGETVTVQEFEPRVRLMERFRRGAAGTAFALGAGIASTLVGDGEPGLELR